MGCYGWVSLSTLAWGKMSIQYNFVINVQVLNTVALIKRLYLPNTHDTNNTQKFS